MIVLMRLIFLVNSWDDRVEARIYRGNGYTEQNIAKDSSRGFTPFIGAYVGFQHQIDPYESSYDSGLLGSSYNDHRGPRHHNRGWEFPEWLPFMPPSMPLPFESGWNSQWPYRWQGTLCPTEDLEADGRVVEKIVYIINLLNLTDADYESLQNGVRSWNFTEIQLTIVSWLMTRLTENLRDVALSLLDKYGPPTTLVDALAAFTVEQKGQIEVLANSRRTSELRTVMRGVIASLPDDDQPQAKKFVALVRYLFGGL